MQVVIKDLKVTKNVLDKLNISLDTPIRIEDRSGRYTLSEGAILYMVTSVINDNFWAYNQKSLDKYGNPEIRGLIKYQAKRLESYVISKESIPKMVLILKTDSQGRLKAFSEDGKLVTPSLISKGIPIEVSYIA